MEEVSCSNETLCYPWSGVIATTLSNKTQLKNELSLLGIDYLKLSIVRDHDGFSGFAVVEFRHGILGLYELLKTEKAFFKKSCGRKDYYGGVRNELYGGVRNELCFWVAREDDYHNPKVGKYLKKNVDLMTVQEYLEQKKRKDKALLSTLKLKLKEKNLMLKQLEKNLLLEQLENKHGQLSLFKMIEEIDKLKIERSIKFEEVEQVGVKARLEDDETLDDVKRKDVKDKDAKTS